MKAGFIKSERLQKRNGHHEWLILFLEHKYIKIYEYMEECKMNKQEMVKAIAERTKLTQVDTSKVLTALEEITNETVKKGGKVQLTGFVTIKPVYRAPRKGFDPIKQVPMEIDATVGISVKAGEKLKASVEELKVEDFAPAAKEDKEAK